MSAALISLWFYLETNTTPQAHYYLVVGKIKLFNDENVFSRELQFPVRCKREISLGDFKEITQIITCNMNMIFGSIKLGGISLHKKGYKKRGLC